MNNTYFYQDKPLFGLDIGYSSIKVMQIDITQHGRSVLGYGVTTFEPAAIKNGVVEQPELLAKAIHDLFESGVVGSINTRRAAFAVPAVRTFNRNMTLPKLETKDLDEAVRLEAEQYIPVPIDELYTDYQITNRNEKETDLLMVAVPKKLIDSYLALSRVLGLDVVSMETTIGASGRLFVQAERSDVPTVLIDFGSISADITIYHRTLVVTGTVPYGGDNFTDAIAKELGISKAEAHVIKTKYGLGASKKQAPITRALTPMLDMMVKEIKRMIRYYEERNEAKSHIGQIVTMGGGANMPGLSEFLTNTLRLPVRMCDPWHNLDFAGLQPPNAIEKSMYVTVAGLALMNPREIFS
jgi:type IV pilus assembly protein PilM